MTISASVKPTLWGAVGGAITVGLIGMPTNARRQRNCSSSPPLRFVLKWFLVGKQ